jgi:hypothetical protein
MHDQMLLPQPPLTATVDPSVQLWVTGITALVAALGLAYTFVDWRRSGKPTFLLLFLSGGLMMVIEPMIDTVGGCWFPATAWTAFKAYGRPIPVWLCLVYFVYFGIGVGVTWRLMRNGLSRGQLWGLYGAAILADFMLEAMLLQFKPYMYYGPQPLMIFKFPLWWAAVNALTTMAAAAVVLRCEAFLTQGWRQLQIIPAVLTVSIAVNAGVGWPSWLVINTPVPPLFTELGGLASFGLSAWFMGIIVRNAILRAAEPVRAPAGVLQN